MRFVALSVHFFTAFSLAGTIFASQCSITTKRGLIWTNVSVGAQKTPLQFAVDTGAEETVLDLKAAKKLNLALGRKETVQGVGGLSHAYRSAKTSVHSAGVTIRKSFLTLDLAPASRKAGRRLDGLLGADFFHGRTVQIDYRTNQLRVLTGYSPGSSAEILPIRRNYGAMCVPVQVGAVHLGRVLEPRNYLIQSRMHATSSIPSNEVFDFS